MRLIKETDFQSLVSSVLTVALPSPFSGNPHGVPAVDARLYEGPHAAASVMKVNGYTAECERSYFQGDRIKRKLKSLPPYSRRGKRFRPHE